MPKEASLYCPRMLTSGNSVKARSRLHQMTPTSNQFRIWNSDDSMPTKEEARLANHPRKLLHDKVPDRHEAAIGWRSYKATDFLDCSSLQQLYPTTLSKNVLLLASDYNRNQNACHQRCPLLVSLPREKRQQQLIILPVSESFLNWFVN